MENIIQEMIVKNTIIPIQFSTNHYEREKQIVEAVAIIKSLKIDEEFRRHLLKYFNGNRIFL